MANRLRRLLFGAPHIARVAPHLQFAARVRRSIGGSVSARWFSATAAGTLKLGWLSARWGSTPPGAPPAETVLVLIQGPELDVAPDLQFARTLSADVRAVYVDEDPDQTQHVISEWARRGAGVPLLVVEGDGLPVAASLRTYVDLLARERTIGAVSVVLPGCESGTCRAKIRCVFRSLVVRLAFGRRAGVRVYGGGLAPARSRRTLAGCVVEA